MAERGDYRSFYCVFWDDADVHALSDRAYRVLTTLKGTLPPAGIGIVYLTQLAERCGCTTRELTDAFQELEAPKPDESLGWIVRERNVVWIVNGLRFEPSLTANNKKHRSYVRERLLAPLGDVPLVAAFRHHYPEWFPDAAPDPNGSPSDAIPMGIGAVSKQSPSRSQSSPSQSSPNQSSPNRNQPSARAEEATIPDEPAAAAIVLASAANRAITERWGEQPTPIRHDAGASHELAVVLLTAGVPIDFARDAIYTCAKESASLERPPRSLKYFHGYVLDRWSASAEYAAAASSDAKVLPAAVNGSGRGRGESASFVAELEASKRG